MKPPNINWWPYLANGRMSFIWMSTANCQAPLSYLSHLLSAGAGYKVWNLPNLVHQTSLEILPVVLCQTKITVKHQSNPTKHRNMPLVFKYGVFMERSYLLLKKQKIISAVKWKLNVKKKLRWFHCTQGECIGRKVCNQGNALEQWIGSKLIYHAL